MCFMEGKGIRGVKLSLLGFNKIGSLFESHCMDCATHTFVFIGGNGS